MKAVVYKYGGTSVATTSLMKEIVKAVVARKKAGFEVVVVVSAMGDTTDRLVELSHEVCEVPDSRELDLMLATGEQVSVSLLTMAFLAQGYDAIGLTGFQAGIQTVGKHTKNKIKDIQMSRIKAALEAHQIVVIAGFQGMNERGDITTLGRGGSDLTAVALASKLKCACHIYTDVLGIYGVDPRLYKSAKRLKEMSYEEMMEMASLGARVMDARAIEVGYRYHVPIYVAKSLSDEEGTWIKEKEQMLEEKVITGLSVSDHILMITISEIEFKLDYIALIFEKLAVAEVNIDMISQTAPLNEKINISFTASRDDLSVILGVIAALKEELGVKVLIEDQISKISVIGMGMMNQSGVTAKVFRLLANHQIQFHQVTTSEVSISYTIQSCDKQKAVQVLAKALNL